MRLCVLIVGIVLLVPAPSFPSTFVVRPDGTGDFPTIQTAIAASAHGDTIELADGVFMGDGNRDVDYLGKAVTVRSRSGDPLSCVISCQGSHDDPHRGFLFQSGEGATSTLEGITIEGGHAQVEVNGGDGGGVACRSGSSPTISGCVLQGNAAAGPPGGGVGGGMSCGEGTSPMLHDCVFIGNQAYRGAALVCAVSSYVSLVGCQFLENEAALGGGVCSLWGDLTLDGCTFSGNQTVYNGAAVHVSGGSLAMADCTLSANAGWFGASLSLWDVPSATIENTLIVLDTQGAALHCDGSPPLLSCCDLYGNAGGDWVDPIADQLGIRGNICEDARFCSAAPHDDRDWSIHRDSPCAPDQSGCGLIGAWGVGCGGTPVRLRSWGGIKASFRK